MFLILETRGTKTINILKKKKSNKTKVFLPPMVKLINYTQIFRCYKMDSPPPPVLTCIPKGVLNIRSAPDKFIDLIYNTHEEQELSKRNAASSKVKCDQIN